MNDYSRHEALDRSHLIWEMIAFNLLDHEYVSTHPALSAVVEKAFDALGEAYQMIGGDHLVEAEQATPKANADKDLAAINESQQATPFPGPAWKADDQAPEGEEVLVYLRAIDAVTTSHRTSDGDWINNSGNKWPRGTVSHYMPLPPPPTTIPEELR